MIVSVEFEIINNSSIKKHKIIYNVPSKPSLRSRTDYPDNSPAVVQGWNHVFGINTLFLVNKAIKHDFSWNNVHQVQRDMFKPDDEAGGFQHLSRDLAKVNALKNVWYKSLHKFNKMRLNFLR